MKSIVILLVSLLAFNLNAATNVWEGTPLQSFSLLDQTGKNRTEKDFTGKWLVLYFYPKNKTPGCTVEAQNFTDDYAKYQKLGADIVGVSYDDIDSHKDFAETYEIPFTLLADTDAKLSKALKVDRVLPWPHASRQTFIINPEGVIVEHIEKVKPQTHSEQVLTKLKHHQSQK